MPRQGRRLTSDPAAALSDSSRRRAAEPLADAHPAPDALLTGDHLLICTAGHIDHGKSRLIHALTGVDPDRLPEEKRRGMTIDLGFAHCKVAAPRGPRWLWFIDVPGHERFIRNMVAGATGIDLPLLVVAVDDSVMPQTREHVELLRLLGFRRCVVALTKCDLADEDWIAAVADDVRKLLAEQDIEPLHVVATSALTGRGIDDLKRILAAAVDSGDLSPSPRPKAAWFRMPIDRAFNVAGRGVVVTGSAQHGGVAPHAELQLLPADRPVRVREVQSANLSVASAAGRLRLALNLSGVSLADVQRGCELATPGYLTPARCVDVLLNHLSPDVAKRGHADALRFRARLHTNTREVLVAVRLAKTPPAAPAAQGGLDAASTGPWAQLIAAEPIVAAWAQPFVLRSENGARTLGGGRIVQPDSRPWTRSNPPRLDALGMLAHGDELSRMQAAYLLTGWKSLTPAQFTARTGLPSDHAAQSAVEELVRRGTLISLVRRTGGVTLHKDVLDALRRHVLDRIALRTRRNARLAGVPVAALPELLPRSCPAALGRIVADWLLETGAVALHGGFVTKPGKLRPLTPADESLLARLLEAIDAGEFRPPALGELPFYTPALAARLRELATRAEALEQLVKLGDDLWLSARHWHAVRERVVQAIRDRGPITVADLRTLLNTTRKYAVPLAEALDAAQITSRNGDLRGLGAKA